MKISSGTLLALFCSAAFAQPGILMNGNVLHRGFTLNYETRLEPPAPPFVGGFVGGNVTDDKLIHRYMAYNAEHKFFGYDLQVDHDETDNTYRVTFLPLSITPARIELENPSSWATISMPAYPSPQTIHPGDSIALDLFVNPATGQKIVEYLHFPRRKGLAATMAATVPYRLAPDDTIHVNVLNENLTIRPDGNIVLIPGGELMVAGLTTAEAA
ncbi:MAG TPA: polysaccharide biosynthesis/export family protein, partial [Bryobacteraceae bacterium]